MTLADLDTLVERTIAALWRGLLRAMDLSRSGDFTTMLERALLARNLQDAVAAVDLTDFTNAVADLQRQLQPIREAAFDVATLDLPKRLQADALVRVNLSRTLMTHPDRARAIAAQDLSRIQGITRETQEAIREVLAKGLREGTHPTALTRELRPLIGLNRQQAKAVANFRARLLADGVKRPPARVERMVERYARQKVRERSEAIARTEVMRAQSEGRRLQWERLVREGALDSAAWEREWVTSHLESVCPICKPFDGQRADIGGLYTSRTGRVSPGPTEHPLCMCTERLIMRGFRAGQPTAPARDKILRQIRRLGA